MSQALRWRGVTALTVIVGVLVIGSLLASRAVAQTTPVPPVPADAEGISVIGEAAVTAAPDRARITLGVEVFNASLAAAQDTARRHMDAVIQRLTQMGVPESNIQSVSISISPQYDTSEGQASTLRGYRVQNLVEVQMSNVGGLGALIDGAVDAGATRVLGVRFEASNLEELKAQAREQAVRQARTKAEQLARHAGVTLGRLQSIAEHDREPIVPLQAQPAIQPGAPTTPIQPGEIDVRVRVHAIWSIL